MTKADVTAAFLQGDELPEPVYCEIPREAGCDADEVLEIYVCVYGLGDGPKKWNIKFTADQKKLGAKQLRTDPCLFCFYKDKHGSMINYEQQKNDEQVMAEATLCGLLALAVYEYQTRILGSDYLAAVFPYSTVHEKVELLHKLFPPFMHGARMISQVRSSSETPTAPRHELRGHAEGHCAHARMHAHTAAHGSHVLCVHPPRAQVGVFTDELDAQTVARSAVSFMTRLTCAYLA